MSRYSLFLIITCLNGCGGAAGAPPRTGPASAAGDEVEVPRTVVTAQGVYDLPELLRGAAAHAAAGRFAQAAAAYDRAYQLDVEGQYAAEALWGAAAAYDQSSDHEHALARFQLFADRERESAQGAAALVRATRLLVFLGRFEPAGANADRLLKKLELLTELARISVFSAKALSLLARDDDQQASYFIEKGRDVVDQNRLDAATPMARDLAPLYYALGESRRIRAERIKFDPLPPNFGAILEARCQLLLDAQSAYADSMRANDSHWSASAGFRIVELYQRLHEELLAIRTPASVATDRDRMLYEGAVRTRYAILLSKAKTMAEHTLSMATRTGETSSFVDRTRESLAAIDRAIAAERDALAKLPYTRADFEAYFAQLEAAAAAKTPSKASSSKPAARP